MTATEELRRLLDERGVEWESGLPTETIVREPNDALYVERPDGRMHVYFRSYLTPEQAIAATLGPCNDSCNCTNGERTDLDAATLGDIDATGGRQGDAGMCRITDNGPWGYPYVCSACGASFDPDVNNGEFNYCPNCGRKVVDE